ncbi:YaeQ family protein [Thiosocius teredinicola]|uniref:YaeQ family protein n=1 Tax=Thiosocius teredinicola TaxID=1973002 RepID=UPI000990F0B2
MALNATIFRCVMQISDLDRGYFNDHTLTIARHPSETDERMMVRLLAFALHAHPDLHFTRGLSQDNEPDIWQKSLTGDIDLWIEVGQPDERRLRKALGRARRVVVYCYQQRSADVWWQQIASKVANLDALSVYKLPDGVSEHLARFAERNMTLQCLVQDGEIWFSSMQDNLRFIPEQLQ